MWRYPSIRAQASPPAVPRRRTPAPGPAACWNRPAARREAGRATAPVAARHATAGAGSRTVFARPHECALDRSARLPGIHDGAIGGRQQKFLPRVELRRQQVRGARRHQGPERPFDPIDRPSRCTSRPLCAASANSGVTTSSPTFCLNSADEAVRGRLHGRAARPRALDDLAQPLTILGWRQPANRSRPAAATCASAPRNTARSSSCTFSMSAGVAFSSRASPSAIWRARAPAS